MQAVGDPVPTPLVLDSVTLRVLGGIADLAAASDGERSALETTAARLHDHGAPIKPGMRFKVCEGVHVALVASEPSDGGFFNLDSTTVVLDPEPLPVFHRVHILPFKDATPPDRSSTVGEYVRPFFEGSGAIPIGVEFEFGYGGCRFQVIGCDPAGPAVIGPTTEVYWEGPPIQRFLARRIVVLPFSHTLPSEGVAGAAPADLLADYVKPYFAQRSAPLRPGDEFETRGVRFRVTLCEPPGTGPAESTEVDASGPAIIACSIPGCSGMATRRCAEGDCGRTLCSRHACPAAEGGSAVACPEHGAGKCSVM